MESSTGGFVSDRKPNIVGNVPKAAPSVATGDFAPEGPMELAPTTCRAPPYADPMRLGCDGRHRFPSVAMRCAKSSRLPVLAWRVLICVCWEGGGAT